MTVKICYHCHPKGKPIFDLQAENAITDRHGNAITDRHGNVKCLTCLKRDFDDETLRYAPNSPAARDIIAARKREEEFKARYERMKKMPGERLSYYHGSGWKRYRP